MSASTGLSAKLDQQARGAIFFLLLVTLALQISWVLPLFGLAGTPVTRHLVRMVTKWLLFVVFIRMMRSGTAGLGWRELGFRNDGWRDRAKQLGLAVALTAPAAVVFAASPTLQNLVLRNLDGGAAVTMPGSAGHLFGNIFGIMFGSIIFGIIAVAFTAAFVEELFWRGYALAVLPARVGLFGAVTIASALFALTHTYLGLSAVVLTFGGGIALSLVYWWKRSLLLNIAIHFLSDVAAPIYVLSKL